MTLLLTDVAIWIFVVTLVAPAWLSISIFIGSVWALATWWPRV